MKLLEKVLGLLYPSVCRLCGGKNGESGEICHDCMAKYVKDTFEICGECGQTAAKCECGCSFLDSFSYTIGGRRLFTLSFYRGSTDSADRVTEKLLYGLKQRADFANFFAAEMSAGIKRLFGSAGEDIDEWVITYVPRSEEKYREYGVDQSEEIVRRMAKILGIKAVRCFERREGQVQKELDYAGRQQNAEQSIILCEKMGKDTGKYLLFDDIVTSGSTVRSAAKLLLESGARAVFPVCISRTRRKK